VSDRPRIGVSACLLGEPVRYDGAHKRDAWLVDVLGPRVEWVAVCPEMEIGLGTPREPIQLERRADGAVALMTVHSRRDLTQTMRRYAARRVDELALADLDGYVLKADSPSCGLDGVRIAQQTGNAEHAAHADDSKGSFSALSASSAFHMDISGHGVFADALLARLPDLPIADERELSDPAKQDAFVDRVFARHRARRMTPLCPVGVVRVRGSSRVTEPDRVVTEEPLEIRLHGRPFAVIMRTPGADRELAAGFLLAERVIGGADDLGAIEYCLEGQVGQIGRVGQAAQMGQAGQVGQHGSNVVNVTLTEPGLVERALAERRRITTNSSCGLCGRRTIESLSADVAPIEASWTVPGDVLVRLPQQLRAGQTVFDETGGLHAAGLFSPNGVLADVAEDVGRHNAVDKVVGRMLMLEQLPLTNHLLCVSGRTSFEIVQKALFAGIPIVAAVSAPSSLAIDLARTFGVTLVGFVRGDRFNIYAHPERIV
jgi:FdhD protein